MHVDARSATRYFRVQRERTDTMLMMRRNEAHQLILQDQVDGSSMEARVARIESDVAKIQVGVRELRTDMKAANESIADLRVAVATVDGKVDALGERLDGKIDALGERLDGKIDALGKRLDGKIDRLDGKVDALSERLDGKIDAL